jgi:hypothetical protein
MSKNRKTDDRRRKVLKRVDGEWADELPGQWTVASY